MPASTGVQGTLTRMLRIAADLADGAGGPANPDRHACGVQGLRDAVGGNEKVRCLALSLVCRHATLAHQTATYRQSVWTYIHYPGVYYCGSTPRAQPDLQYCHELESRLLVDRYSSAYRTISR
jgi:hypothetical protein